MDVSDTLGQPTEVRSRQRRTRRRRRRSESGPRTPARRIRSGGTQCQLIYGSEKRKVSPLALSVIFGRLFPTSWQSLLEHWLVVKLFCSLVLIWSGFAETQAVNSLEEHTVLKHALQFLPVFWFRIRISGIPMFLGLLDLDWSLFCMDLGIRILPSTSKISKKNLDFYYFVPFLYLWCKCTFKK
jgi:hypothetical protein